MADLISTISTVVTAVIGWMGSVVDFIIAQPLILVPIVAFFFVGGAVGMVNRLIRG